MTDFAPRSTGKALGGSALLEMLVTVAIMAAVAGIGMMALGKVSEDTQKTVMRTGHVRPAGLGYRCGATGNGRGLG
ncbi:MAG: hypothetical protein HRU33_01945 [Rhodobacteraceae bacterium]|nr:hypothetical protein [Paracoccaceae bacterium]